MWVDHIFMCVYSEVSELKDQNMYKLSMTLQILQQSCLENFEGYYIKNDWQKYLYLNRDNHKWKKGLQLIWLYHCNANAL